MNNKISDIILIRGKLLRSSNASSTVYTVCTQKGKKIKSCNSTVVVCVVVVYVCLLNIFFCVFLRLLSVSVVCPELFDYG
jgi:hypothetical protein